MSRDDILQSYSNSYTTGKRYSLKDDFSSLIMVAPGFSNILRMNKGVDISPIRLINRIAKKKDKKKKVPEFNYRLLERDLSDLSTPSQVSLISEKDYFSPDLLEANREVVRETLVEEFEAGYMADRKTLEMFVYTPPEVKMLRDSITVDEMYRAAEIVLGTYKQDEENEEGDKKEQEVKKA